jgi:hypothetical protein
MTSGQDFAARIREQARNAAAPHVTGLGEGLQELQASLSTLIHALGSKIELMQSIEIPMVDSILTEAANESSEAAIRQRDAERVALTHFAHDMRAKETQEELLNLLLDEAGRFAPRVGLFIVREDNFQAWSCRGFSEDTTGRFSSITFSQAQSPFMQRALVSEGLVSSSDFAAEAGSLDFMAQEASGPWHAFPLIAIKRPVAVLVAAAADTNRCDLESLCLIMNIAGLCLENLALKILQEMRTQARVAPRTPPPVPAPVPAQGMGQAPPEAPLPVPGEEAIQPGLQPAAAVVEEQSPEMEAPVAAVEAAFAPEPVTAEETAAQPAEPEQVAVEEPGAGAKEPVVEIKEPVAPVVETVAPETEPVAHIEEPISATAGPVAAVETQVVPEPPPIPETALEAAALEQKPVSEEPEIAEIQIPSDAQDSPVHEAAVPSLAAEPMEVAAASSSAEPAMTPPVVEPPPVAQFRPSVFPTPSDAQRLSEEEKLHSDAKRFARLLVSEIKLYNEQRVLEGREHRDIYVRLKRDIDRSREMYQKRVAPSVIRKVDYFHDEIVRILGDNDPSTLGSDYPGPLAES